MSAVNASLSPQAPFLQDLANWIVNTPLPTVVAALSLVIVSFLLFPLSSDEGKIHDIGEISIIAAWRFFTRRYDFIQRRFEKSGGKNFRFNLLQHRVVAIAGESARKAFFNEPGFSFLEGYKILQGGAPESKDIVQTNGEVHPDAEKVDFVKRLVTIIRKDRIEAALPVFLEDLNKRLASDWGNEGTIDPFKELRELVCQMTVRLATCKELSDDRKITDELIQYLSVLETSATPVSLILPWFSGPAKKARDKAATALSTLLFKFVVNRRKSAAPSTDTIDLLIAQGDRDESIVGTIMRILFSAVTNTGVISSWILLRLGSNPKWREKATNEYKALVANYTNTFSSDSPLHKRLTAIPLNAWEDELPEVDLVIRETIRLTSTGSIIRRNMRQDITVDGLVIKPGDFVTYQVADAHLNPKIYTEPTEFDPERYLAGREEDRKESFAYVGWGAGRHPCVGMKNAKLEIKLILAFVLLGFEYELVDDSGKYPQVLPVPDKNDNHQALPLGGPYYLKFKRVKE